MVIADWLLKKIVISGLLEMMVISNWFWETMDIIDQLLGTMVIGDWSFGAVVTVLLSKNSNSVSPNLFAHCNDVDFSYCPYFLNYAFE